MCGGGASQTTTSNFQIPGQKQGIKAAKQYQKQWGRDRPLETDAYGGIQDNSAWAEGMMPYEQQLIQHMYGGAGLGEGADYIRDAYGQASQAYSPYLQQGFLDPMSNPYLQPAIEAARSSAMNSVADRFHKAGRSFSGAEGAAYGDAVTKAALPMLLNQYNQNAGLQQGAAQGLLGGATASSTGLDQAMGNQLKARMAAGQQMQNLNIPENMLLGIVDRQRKAAYDAAALRVAAMSGTPTSQTSTTTQSSDPFQALLGGGLGLLGALI